MFSAHNVESIFDYNNADCTAMLDSLSNIDWFVIFFGFNNGDDVCNAFHQIFFGSYSYVCSC